MMALLGLLIGIATGLLVGYLRIFGIIKRYFIYHIGLDNGDADRKLDELLQNYKYIKKKHYRD